MSFFYSERHNFLKNVLQLSYIGFNNMGALIVRFKQVDYNCIFTSLVCLEWK